MRRIALLMVGLLGLAAAQSSPPKDAAGQVKLTLTQFLVNVTQSGGKPVEERVASPSGVLPGATLEEEISAQNIAGKALAGVTITLPLPPRTRYLGRVTSSNSRWRTQFTAPCGGRPLAYAETPLRCTETVNGQSVTRTVAPGEYTAVRWVVNEMQTGETLKFGFRVQVK